MAGQAKRKRGKLDNLRDPAHLPTFSGVQTDVTGHARRKGLPIPKPLIQTVADHKNMSNGHAKKKARPKRTLSKHRGKLFTNLTSKLCLINI